MASTDHQRSEELRFACREVLATRPGAALTLDGIRRRIEKDHLIDGNFTDDQLEAALAFLVGLNPPHLAVHHGELGASRHWVATSAGILAHERRS